MIARYNRRANGFGITGLLLMFAGPFIVVSTTEPPFDEGAVGVLLPVLWISGFLMMIVAFAYYAEAKGRSPYWCLAGVLGIFGLIILVLLRDCSPRESRPQSETARKSNGSARGAVYLGLFSVLPGIGFLFAIGGVISGIIGLRAAHERGGRIPAIAGIAMSCIFSLGWLTAIGLSHMETVAKERKRQQIAERAALRAQARAGE